MNGVERSNDGVKLRKCPFCGGDCLYKTFEVNDLGDNIPVIFCNSCKTVFKVENDSPYLNSKKTYEYLEEKNIKAWNNRTPLERVIERLETEGKLADEERDRCARENPLHFDTAKGYTTGIYNAIEIIKEELM